MEPDPDGFPDPWAIRHHNPGVGGPHYPRLIEAMRTLQDDFISVSPPDEEVLTMALQLEELSARMATFAAPQFQAPAGMRGDLPGRGSPLLVPVIVDESTDTTMRGRVTFRPFHLGGNGAAHGGTIPLMFDDIFGRLVNGGRRAVARTAYLHVNYRRIARLGVELEVEASLDREEGRKRWATGRLLHDGEVVSDAEGLFIALRPGQP